MTPKKANNGKNENVQTSKHASVYSQSIKRKTS